jgi:hypothetical protein
MIDLEKNVPGVGWIFIQPLSPIPIADRAAYLSATYGKRAAQFRIVERATMSPARIRAMDLADWKAIGRPSAPVPSAASAIIAKLRRERG